MEKDRKVIWSGEADKNLESILNYLKINWTSKEEKSFLLKLEKTIILISDRPKLFKATNSRKNLRKCVLNKQTSIIYKAIDKNIFIVALFDNRQDPEKISK